MRTGLTWTTRAAMLGALVAQVAIGGACRRQGAVATPEPTPTPAAGPVIVFPKEYRAEDASANEFVRLVIETCAAEDYDAFRLLWSARDEPIGEAEFIRGWRATRKVSILNLQKRRDPRDGQIVYVVHGLVEFDPDKVPTTEREIVLLLVKEHEDWRIARAPRKVAKALKGELTESADTNGIDTTGD